MVNSLSYSLKEALAAQRSTSIKSAKLVDGTVLKVSHIHQPTDDNPNPNGQTYNRDSLVVTTKEGKRIRIPIREYMNYAAAEGSKLVNEKDTGDDLCDFPHTIKITESADRVITRDGKEITIFPIQAYNAGQAQIDAREFDFDALIASGEIEGHTFDPVQNYTIETEF